MGGALPFLINVGVTLLAGGRVHEVVLRDDLAGVRLCGTGKEGTLRAAAFIVHGGRGDGGIANHIGPLPGNCTHPPRAVADRGHQRQAGGDTHRGSESVAAQPAAMGDPNGEQDGAGQCRESLMRVEERRLAAAISRKDDGAADQSASQENEPADLLGQTAPAQELRRPRNAEHHEGGAPEDVEHDDGFVVKSGSGKGHEEDSAGGQGKAHSNEKSSHGGASAPGRF